MTKPNFYAILPAHIRYSTILNPFEKLLYAEVTALAQKEGFCYANNTYFATVFDKSTRWVSKSLSVMETLGFIRISQPEKTGEKRKIYIVPMLDEHIGGVEQKFRTPGTKVPPPLEQKFQHNNINNNNINNNIAKDKPLQPFIFEEALKKMEDSPRLDLQLIAYFIREKKLKFTNREQLAGCVSRHVRAAKQCVAFEKEKVLKAFKEVKELADRKPFDWTLDTVHKQLTK